jgi:hypothetical protein
LLAPIALTAVLAAGCSNGPSEDRPIATAGGGGGGGGTLTTATGTANVALTGLTDQPFTTGCFPGATVAVTGIGLHRVGDPAGTFTLITPPGPQSVDLLPLATGATVTAASASIPAGTFDAVDIFVPSGTLTFAGTGAPVLPFASDGTGAIEAPLNVPLVLAPSGTANVLVDLDVGQIFALPAGTPVPADCATLVDQAGLFRFTPAVRAINLDASTLVTGTIVSQATSTGVGGATVSAIDQTAGNGLTAPVSTLTTTQGTTGLVPGSFVLFLPPGTFTLSIGIPGVVGGETTTSLIIPPGTPSTNLGPVMVP